MLVDLLILAPLPPLNAIPEQTLLENIWQNGALRGVPPRTPAFLNIGQTTYGIERQLFSANGERAGRFSRFQSVMICESTVTQASP